MIAAELRGGNKPSLNEALGWIGSRVDDIYGANVGRLEDVWIDPGTGAPRWLLVKEGRFGGRTTLIPFEDATAGAGHVWVPYEREIVREAPEIEPGAPLTQQVEAALRSHYAANVPAAIAHSGVAPEGGLEQGQAEPAGATATLRFATGGGQPTPPPSFGSPQGHPGGDAEQRRQTRPPAQPGPRRPVLREQPRPAEPPRGSQGMPPPPLPPRPAPPVAAPPREQAPPAPGQAPPAYGYAQPQYQAPPPPPYGTQPPPQPRQAPTPQPPQYQAPPPQPPQGWAPYPPPAPPYAPPAQPAQPSPAAWPPPQAPDPVAMLNALSQSPQVHYVEIELSGELSIRGELRTVRVIPQPPGR